MYQRIILGISAMVFIGIGVAFLVTPQSLLPRVNINATPGTALTDVRAVYGGLDLGIGLFLAFCFVRGQLRTGLVACVFTLGGLSCGRILGIGLNREQDMITYYLLAAEVLGVAMATTALMMGGPTTERKL